MYSCMMSGIEAESDVAMATSADPKEPVCVDLATEDEELKAGSGADDSSAAPSTDSAMTDPLDARRFVLEKPQEELKLSVTRLQLFFSELECNWTQHRDRRGWSLPWYDSKCTFGHMDTSLRVVDSLHNGQWVRCLAHYFHGGLKATLPGIVVGGTKDGKDADIVMQQPRSTPFQQRLFWDTIRSSDLSLSYVNGEDELLYPVFPNLFVAVPEQFAADVLKRLPVADIPGKIEPKPLVSIQVGQMSDRHIKVRLITELKIASHLGIGGNLYHHLHRENEDPTASFFFQYASDTPCSDMVELNKVLEVVFQDKQFIFCKLNEDNPLTYLLLTVVSE